MNKLDKLDILCAAISSVTHAIRAWRKADEPSYCQVAYPCDVVRMIWRELPLSLRKDKEVAAAVGRFFPHLSEGDNLQALLDDARTIHKWAHRANHGLRAL